MKFHAKGLSAVMAFLLAVTASAGLSRAQDEPTFVGTNVDERVIVALQVDEAAAQAWLPEGWVVAKIGDGPFSDANLMAVFIDRLLQLNAEGQTAAGGAFRSMALMIPARRVNTDNTTNIVIRIYSAHEGAGPYKNSAMADVSRSTMSNGSNIGAGTGKETWQVNAGSGGTATLNIEYQREIPTPRSEETQVRSSVDPEYYRVYYVNQLVDIVNSSSEAIDRAPSHNLSVDIPELSDLFDGNQKTVGIAVIPSYARQTFLP